jgi:hypothetical protein
MAADKYARDHDNIETILSDARETAGQLIALIDVLSKKVRILRAATEAATPAEEGRE